MKTLYLEGFGRHTRAEQERLAVADIDALAALLGTKPYLMGDKPCGADAAIFSFVAHVPAPAFTSPIRTAAGKHQNLIAYCDSIRRDYFESQSAAFAPS